MDLTSLALNMSWLAAVCFLLGLVFVVIEMFHPGISAPGIIGTILLILAVVLTARTVIDALVMIGIILLILGAFLTMVLHSATKGRLSRTLVLSHTAKREDGFIGTEDLAYFLGREGTAVTVLRPAGMADFDGVRLDVVTDGEFLPKGTSLKIIKVEGRRIVVKEETSL